MTSEIKAQNFYQLVSLLIDNGSIVLRELFKKHALAQAVSLDMYLFNHRITLDDLHNKKRVLTPKQMDLLFPSNGSADITTFDITLLSSLLKNICGSLPHQEKQDIEELKNYRNEVSAHATKAAVDETDFNLLWQKISLLITNLSQFSGDPSFIQKVKDDIEDLRKCPKLKPSSFNTNLLLEWCNKDHEVAQLLCSHHAALTARFDKIEVSNAEMKAVVQNSDTPRTANSLCETCMYIQGETSTEGEQNEKLQLNKRFLIENICVVTSVNFFVKKKYFGADDKANILMHARRVRRAVVFINTLIKIDNWYTKFLKCLLKTNQEFVAAELERPLLHKGSSNVPKSWDQSVNAIVDDVQTSHSVQLRDACLKHGLSLCKCEKRSLVFVLYTDDPSVTRNFEYLCKTGDVHLFLDSLLQQKQISTKLASLKVSLSATIRKINKKLHVPAVTTQGQDNLRMVLNSYASYLIDEIDPVPLTEDLTKMGMFTSTDLAEILHDIPVTRRHRVKRILAKCITQGVSFADFVGSLRRCHLNYVALYLQSGQTGELGCDVRSQIIGNYGLILEACTASSKVKDVLLEQAVCSPGFFEILEEMYGNDKHCQAMHLVQSLLESDSHSLEHLVDICNELYIPLTEKSLTSEDAILPTVIEIEFDVTEISSKAKNQLEDDPNVLFAGEITREALEGHDQPLQALIQQNLSFLEEELDMFYLKDRFLDTKVFSESEMPTFAVPETRRKRSNQLLLRLLKKDENTLKAFLHVLLDAEEEYVFQHLLEESKKTERIRCRSHWRLQFRF